ncbi:OmpA family protein [Shewanella maritima]|uniref:OmpA family protein n=1 Tax=Shewanella maritima TaxID=2520507 RepID=UPI0037368EC0
MVKVRQYLFGSALVLLVQTSALAMQWTDSDGDGVPDSKDACPDTPAGVRVMANGCQDPDDIALAKQLAQSAKSAVNQTEMSEDTVAEAVAKCQKLSDYWTCINRLLVPVYFPFGSADVLATQVPNIQRLTDVMAQLDLAQLEKVKLTIKGHTDDIGTDEVNQRLSFERAQAVQKLVEQKLTTQFTISVIGMSNKKSISSNASSEGRQINRRVEFYISAE